MKKQIRNSSRGGILSEIALMIPLLFLLSQGIIEITKFMRFQQSVSIISREIANGVFRNCALLQDADVQNCVQSQVSNLLIKLPALVANPSSVNVLAGMHRLSAAGASSSNPNSGGSTSGFVQTAWVYPGTSVSYSTPANATTTNGGAKGGISVMSGSPNTSSSITPGACKNGTCYTAFNQSRFDIGGDLYDLISKNGVVVTTEVFYSYEAFGPVGRLLFSKEHFIVETSLF